MAVTGSSGSSSAAAAAAAAAAEARRRAEEARRRAEEARRRAEEARRKAEAARKQAEAAKKAQAEAAKRAREQQKALEAQQKQLKAANGPDKKDVKAQVEKSQAAMKERQQELEAANKKLQAAQEQVVRASKEAEDAMRAANTAAKSEGKPQPYAENQIRTDGVQSNEVKSAFEGAGRRRDDLARTLGIDATTNKNEIAQSLEADRQYAKLASKPENSEALAKLGINDGESLRSFGQRLDRVSREGGSERVNDIGLDQIQDKKALANIIQGAGASLDGQAKAALTDEKFASKIAAGRDPREARQELEGLSETEKQARQGDAAKGLRELGVSQGDFRDLSAKDQEAYLAAAKQAAAGDYRKAVDSLADAGKGAEEAITTAAQKLTGPEKTLLTDSESVKALLASKDGQKAIDQFAAGNVSEGLRALGDKVPDQVAETLANDRTLQKGLEKLGLDADDFTGSGAAMADLAKAALATDPQQAITALADAGKANKDFADDAASAIATRATDLPAGTARSILTDEKLAGELIRGDRKAFDAVVAGDTAGAIAKLGDNKELQGRLIDQAAKDPAFKQGLAEAGLTVDQLKSSGKGADELFKAAELLGQPNTMMSPDRAMEIADTRRREALSLMQQAAEQDPAARDAAVRGITTTAKNLSGGAEQGILTDPTAVKALLDGDKAGRSALTQVINGDAPGAYAALEGKEKLQAQLLTSAAKDPEFKDALKKLGLTDTQIARARGGDALFAAADRFAEYDKSGALAELRRAYERSPELALDATQSLAKTLGTEGTQGKLRTLLEDKGTAEALLKDPALKDSFEAFSRFDIAGGLDKLPQNAQLRGAVIDTLAKNAEFAKGLKETGLTVADLKGPGAQQGLGELYRGIDYASQGKFEDSLAAFKAAIGNGASADLATRGVTGFAGNYIKDEPAESSAMKSLLTDGAFVKNLLTNPQLDGAFKAFSSKGLLDALGSVNGDKTAANQAIDALLKNKDIQSGLEAIGITEKQLRDNLPALPQLIGAATSAADGKLLQAIGFLDQASKADGVKWETIRSAIKTTAEGLPDTGANKLIKDLLKEDESIDAAFKAGGFADSLREGDVGGALQAIVKSPDALEVVGDSLVKNPAVAAFLAPLGVKTGEDLKQLGAVAGDVLAAVGEFADGNVGEGLKQLASAFTNLPDEKRGQFIDNVVGKLAAKLPIPEQYKGLVTAMMTGGAKLITDPEFQEAMTKGFDALKSGDIPEFIAQLSAGMKAATEAAPEEVTRLLNAIGEKVPGPLGQFFSDTKLNGYLVETGALGEAFEAVQNLAEGKVLDALKSVAGVMVKLKDAGGEWSVGGYTLPVGREGFEAVGRLFGQVFEVMPDKFKAKINAKIAEIGGKGLVGSIPFVGDAINIAGDIGPFVDALKNGDSLDKILTGATLGLDIVGIVPGLDFLTTPLKAGIGVVKVVKEIGDTVETAQEFKEAFA